MSGALVHSPADVLLQAMIDLALVVDPSLPLADWQGFSGEQPTAPDNCVTVYDTQGRDLARRGIGGQRAEHHGVQIRVRSVDHETGYLKARALAVALDADSNVLNRAVHLGGHVYNVQSFCRTGDVIAVGKDTPTSKLSIFTINAVVPIRMTS